MSLAALNYMMELDQFPDGTDLRATDKLVGLVLADAHNRHSRMCWPSVPLIARKARLSVATVQRTLIAMESHGIIQCSRSERQGRGQITEYVFPCLRDINQEVPKKQGEGVAR